MSCEVIKFDTKIDQNLPKVPVLWQYVGNDSVPIYGMYKDQGVHAYVLAGYGAGSAAADLRAVIAQTTDPESDTVFVNASRTKDSLADNFLSYDPKGFMLGLVYGGTLSPYEAKIFLQLVLAGLQEHHPELMKIVDQLPARATLREKVRAIATEFLYRRLGLPARTE